MSDAVENVAAEETDYAPGIESNFEIVPDEGSYEIDDIEGTIPSYLNGHYYLNGPALFRHPGADGEELRYRHWLDGDGLVQSLRFENGQVRYTARLVNSTKRRDETEAGHALYRTFGTRFEKDRLKRGIGLESPVNVSAFPWNGTLLAFGEQGLPWELDPETLETRREYTFGGRLNAISPLSAHPCFDQHTGEMFNFGISFAARRPSLQLYRFAADEELVYRRRLALDFPCSVHDFIISKNYVLFFLSPHVLNIDLMLKEGKTVMEALQWEPERGSQLLVVARETGEEVTRVALGRGYCLHLINAVDDGDQITLDVIELERPVYDQYEVLPNLFVNAPRGRPCRRVITLAKGDAGASRLISEENIEYRVSQDFPAIDPRRALQECDELWCLGISQTSAGLGRKFFDELAHLRWGASLSLYRTPNGRYLGGEPIFLPDPQDPRRGVILCQELDAEHQKSYFLLFDAYAVDAGPIARMRLRRPNPLGFHASWHS